MARVMQFTFNSTVKVIQSSPPAVDKTLVADGQDWANFVDSTDANCMSEQDVTFAPGSTTVIDLPINATKGVAIAWKFSKKVELAFDGGSLKNTQYGLQQGDFTTLSVIVDPAETETITGHLVLLGA